MRGLFVIGGVPKRLDREHLPKCPYRVAGCDGRIEQLTKYTLSDSPIQIERAEEGQAVCSKCGVLFLGNARRIERLDPKMFRASMSLEMWKTRHHNLVVVAEKKKLWRRLFRRMKK